MQTRKADAGNWQARAQEFAVGQSVALINGGRTDIGRVSAVYPAIGMVDVEFAHTSTRLPVEDVLILSPDSEFVAPIHENVPGGAGIGAFVSTSGNHPDSLIEMDVTSDLSKLASRVASAHIKKGLYWNARDRKYRCSKSEHSEGHYNCPRRGCDGVLKDAVYKRIDGQSVRLLGCPTCMFLIREKDILTDHCGGCE